MPVEISYMLLIAQHLFYVFELRYGTMIFHPTICDVTKLKKSDIYVDIFNSLKW